MSCVIVQVASEISATLTLLETLESDSEGRG